MSREPRQFITKLFNKFTISELRLILKNEGSVDLYYDITNDIIAGPTLIFNISKFGKDYKLIRYIQSDDLYDHNLIGNYHYGAGFGKHNIIEEEIIDSLSNILARINFKKSFKVIKEIINIENIDHQLLVGDSNPNNLPFNKYYLDTNYAFEYNPNKIHKWYDEDYFRVFKHALNYLGINYKEVKSEIIWFYSGIKFITTVDSFGWIGYGVCYKLGTTPFEKVECDQWGNLTGKIQSIYRRDINQSSSWLIANLIDYILAVNILNSTSKTGQYGKLIKCENFDDLIDISTILINKKILHSGDPTYIIDSVFDNYNDQDEWINGSKYLKSQFPSIDKIEKESKKILLSIDSNIISKLKELGLDNVIIGYYGFREMYVHPNPYNHSSMNAWRFNNPIVLNIELEEVEYHHLHNNKTLPYPRIKFDGKDLLVEAGQNKLRKYCYKIPLENGIV